MMKFKLKKYLLFYIFIGACATSQNKSQPKDEHTSIEIEKYCLDSDYLKNVIPAYQHFTSVECKKLGFNTVKSLYTEGMKKAGPATLQYLRGYGEAMSQYQDIQSSLEIQEQYYKKSNEMIEKCVQGDQLIETQFKSEENSCMNKQIKRMIFQKGCLCHALNHTLEKELFISGFTNYCKAMNFEIKLCTQKAESTYRSIISSEYSGPALIFKKIGNKNH